MSTLSGQLVGYESCFGGFEPAVVSEQQGAIFALLHVVWLYSG